MRYSLIGVLFVSATILTANCQSRGEQYRATNYQQFGQSPHYSQQQYQQQFVQQPSYNNPPSVQYVHYSQPSNVRPQIQQQQVVPQQFQSNPNYQSNRNPTNYQSRPSQASNQFSQGQTLESRFQGDDPSVVQNQYSDISTRPPKNPPLNVKPYPKPGPLNVDSRIGENSDKPKLNWDQDATRGAEVFSLTLFGLLEYVRQEQGENSNYMISPLSIHSLLSLVAEGAGGNTFTQLRNSLGFVDKTRMRDFFLYNNETLKRNTADITLSQFSTIIADVNRPVQNEYDLRLEKVYKVDILQSDIRNLDDTLKKINTEVAQKTKGQILQAVTRDDLLKAQFVLLSGVNFQGNWKNVFNVSNTKREPFKDINDEQTIGQVNMMFQRGNFPFAAIRDIGSYFVELPYGNIRNPNDDRISMIAVLPKKGQTLYETIDKIHRFGLEKVLYELKKAKEEYDDEEVEVHLPRFEAETSLNLVDTLKIMNITDVFEQDKADLKEINPSYYVSSVLHKTKIRVDEKGTEAAAVTTSIFANKATPPKFHANRPFLYFIVDKSTRIILFAGVYKTPSLY